MIRRLLLISAFILSSTQWCYAQAIPDASRIEEQLNLEAPPSTQLTSKPPPQKSRGALLPGAETTYFFLEDIVFSGVTAYSRADLDKLIGDMRHRQVSIADIYLLADRITDKYRADGYVIAQAFLPPQSIKGGVIRITVVEPYVDEVIVQGNGADFKMVNLLLAQWRAKKLLNVNDLEKTLLLINDLPGTHVQSVLEPQIKGADSGAMVLRLVFSEGDRWAARISFDNYGSKFIGPYQVGSSISLDNVFGYMAQTSIQSFVTSQLDELAYINLGQNIPLYHPGLTLNVAANYSRVLPGYTLEKSDIKSQSRLLSIGLTQSVVRSRTSNFELAALLESRSSTTKVLGSLLSEDKLTIASLSGKYEVADAWNGTSTLNLTIRQGLDILGARKTGSADLSRAEGKSDFTSIQLQVSRLHGVSDAFGIFSNIRGQYALSPLLSSEEFGYGGNAIGRAFNASEIVGDRGVSATLEVRYKMAVSSHFVLRPYAFYDIGKTWNLDKIDGQNFSGASAGVGTRGIFSNGLSFEAFIAKPLTRRIETPQYGSGTDPVFKFSLEYQF